MTSTVTIVLAQLLTQAPVLLVYLTGMILAVAFWRRCPRASLLTLIATLSLFVLTIVQTSLVQYLIQSRADMGWDTQGLSSVLSAIAIAGSLIRAGGTGLVLAAVFVGRGVTAAGAESMTTGSAALSEPQLGIGGWLVFPAIGFVLGPFVGVLSLIVALSLFSGVAAAGYGAIYALELFVQIGLLAFMIYAATRFFGRRSNAPSTIIVLLTVSLVAPVLLLIIELAAGAEAFAIESVKQLVGGLIGAAIWIPYFRLSKRVKATFVS